MKGTNDMYHVPKCMSYHKAIGGFRISSNKRPRRVLNFEKFY